MNLFTGQDSVASLTTSAQIFSTTVYPLVRDYCSGCHETANAPFFAFRSDIQQSHDAIVNGSLVQFMAPENSKLVQQLVNGHNCWGNCESNADQMFEAIQIWDEQRGSDGSGGEQILTEALVVPGEIAPGNMTKTMTFSLSGLAEGVPSGTVLEFDIKKFDNFSYQVLNPVVKTTSPVYVKHLYMYLNGAEVQSASSYHLIDVVAQPLGNPPGSVGFSISSSAVLIAIANGPGLDQIHLGFDDLGTPPDPQQQKFSAILGLIDTYCQSCHSTPKTYTFNSEQRVVPAFASFTTEEQFAAITIGTDNGNPRFLMIPGDPGNSILWQSVKERSGPGGATPDFPSVMNPMPPNYNNNSQRAQRAQWASQIADWILTAQ